LLRFTHMADAKKSGAVERKSTRPPPGHSEARVKKAPKWSPTLPSASPPASEPDALAEAHAAIAEARSALDAAVLALDRLPTTRRR
jgi:hypothetical protein